MGLRFFADHCISNLVIQMLRDAGHEVLRLRDYMPRYSADSVVILKAQELDSIPDGAQLVFLPEYDPELCKENLRLIESLHEKGKPVVYIKFKKLAPQKSRIRHVTIELAKAG